MGGTDLMAGVRSGIALVLAASMLAGCSESLPSLPKLNDLNPFAEKQQPLPGKRLAIGQDSEKGSIELAVADRPIILPAARANDDWPQPGGPPTNSPGNLAVGAAVKQLWSADAGTGSSSTTKLTASPIVYDGRVFTMDANARVTSFSLSGGSAVWRQSLTPEKERDREGYGGGLAADNGRLYAATGFGTVVAIDAKSGKRIWEKFLGAPIRTSPTAFGDRVVVTTMEGRVFSLAGPDGSELWTYRGVPQQASLIANPSAAIDGDIIVVPYATGELVALKSANGDAAWTETLTKTRAMAATGTFADAARPVIDGGVVFAVGYGGRMVAKQLRTGTTLWSLNVASTQPPAVGGDAVFVVDSGGQLMAVNRRDGKVIWQAKLPTATWSGPTLAGDRLWLVSSKGAMVSVDPATGKVTGQSNLGNASYIAPIVAQGRLFVLTDNAKLMVFG